MSMPVAPSAQSTPKRAAASTLQSAAMLSEATDRPIKGPPSAHSPGRRWRVSWTRPRTPVSEALPTCNWPRSSTAGPALRCRTARAHRIGPFTSVSWHHPEDPLQDSHAASPCRWRSWDVMPSAREHGGAPTRRRRPPALPTARQTFACPPPSADTVPRRSPSRRIGLPFRFEVAPIGEPHEDGASILPSKRCSGRVHIRSATLPGPRMPVAAGRRRPEVTVLGSSSRALTLYR